MSGSATDKSIARSSQSFQFVDEVTEELAKVLKCLEPPRRGTKEFEKYSKDFKDAVTIILRSDEKGDFLTDCGGARAHTGNKVWISIY